MRKGSGSLRRRVVILDENLPVPLDRRVWLEARTLVEAGYSVTVISPMGEGEMGRRREVRDGVEILRYPQRAASGLRGYLVEYLPSMLFTGAWLLWLRSRHRLDIIHGCNPPDLFFVFGAAGRMFGAKYVFDQHDANPELSAAKWGRRGFGNVLYGLTVLLERASYATATTVIVPNDSYGRIARDRGRVEEARVAVVRNAPPADSFRELAAGIRPASQPPFRIGYLGVMGSQDGVELLIEAAAELRKAAPELDFSVDLVGDGEARSRLERMAEELGVGTRLHFHGYRRAEYFVPLLAQTHVCVCPDPPTPFNKVSTMTKVVEYLAMGRPAVIFDLDETRRLLGAAGTVVDEPTPAGLARELRRLASDPGALTAVSVAATTRFSELELSWERSSERLISAYRQLAL